MHESYFWVKKARPNRPMLIRSSSTMCHQIRSSHAGKEQYYMSSFLRFCHNKKNKESPLMLTALRDCTSALCCFELNVKHANMLLMTMWTCWCVADIMFDMFTILVQFGRMLTFSNDGNVISFAAMWSSNLSGPWMCIQNVTAIQPTVAEIFQSRPVRWTHRETNIALHYD